MWDSIDKLTGQIATVANDPFTANGRLKTPPPNGIIISNSFWRSYTCHTDCGGCCYPVSLEWLPDEWETVISCYPDLRDLGEVRVINISNDDYQVIGIRQPKGLTRCRFLDGWKCGIHKTNTVSCQVELIKLQQSSKGWGYIRKAPYSRGWAMKSYVGNSIMCEMADFSEEQFLKNDIPVLRRIKRWADFFGIQTRLEEIISSLLCVHESGYHRRMEFRNEVTLF